MTFAQKQVRKIGFFAAHRWLKNRGFTLEQSLYLLRYPTR